MTRLLFSIQHAPPTPIYAVACSAVHEAETVWLCRSQCAWSWLRVDLSGDLRYGPKFRSSVLD